MSAVSPGGIEALPWLAQAGERVRNALARGRLGHAILVTGAPGLGKEAFARWLAAMVLCDEKARSPCRQCTSCRLLAAGNHPDFHWMAVDRADKATQIKIEQVRELAEVLGYKSYRGGFKAAVIAEADAMNVNTANALLKTLEEPPPSTLLVLCSARPSRLPATIVSRCQRIAITPPDPAAALAWLNAHKALERWPVLLEHAAGAPLRALELEAAGFLDLDRDMQGVVERLAQRKLDIQATAERWHKTDLGMRLAWLDAWIARQVRRGLVPLAERPRLPAAHEIRNIHGLFALLDRVRAFKLELDTPLNKQLATEELLMRAETVLGS